MKSNAFALTALLAGAALAPSAAQAVLIDAFKNNFPVKEVFPGYFFGALQVDTAVSSDAASQAGLSHVLGGHRDSELLRFGAFGSDITTVASGGFLSYSSAFGLTGKLTLEYGSALNLDTDMSAATHFEFGLEGDLDDSNPQRPVPVTITITSARGTMAEATASYTQMMLSDGVQTFDFSNFAGVDFSDVDALTFVFDGSAPNLQAIDFALTRLRAVPTPGAAALLACAAPLTLRRRR